MKRLVTAALVIALMASAANATYVSLTGTPPFTGNRTTATGAGLHGSGSWTTGGPDGGIEISWNISQITSGAYTGDWNYCYTFTEPNGSALKENVCHMLLEVSTSITAQNYKTIIWGANSSICAPQTWTATPSGITLPSSIYAIDLYNDSPVNVFSFTSSHSPMWGSFAGDWTDYVWNSGIGGYPNSGGPYTNWIPVPDTTLTGAAPGVPEPATMALLGIGLLGAFVRRKIARA